MTLTKMAIVLTLTSAALIGAVYLVTAKPARSHVCSCPGSK